MMRVGSGYDLCPFCGRRPGEQHERWCGLQGVVKEAEINVRESVNAVRRLLGFVATTLSAAVYVRLARLLSELQEGI